MQAPELGGNKVVFEEKIRSIWESMCLKPDGSTSEKYENDHKVDPDDPDDSDPECCTVESVVSENAEPTDLIVNCPLWRDLPEGLADTFLAHAEDAGNHFELLDASLHDLLICHVPSSIFAESTPVAMATAAADTLHRLPKSSARLPDNMCSVGDNIYTSHEAYLLTSPSTMPHEHVSSPSWESYKVTTLFDTNTIRLALLVAYLDRTTHPLASQTMQGYVNLLSRLLESLSAPHEPRDPGHSFSQRSYRVVQAFLWTAWQRSLLLFSYYVFGTRLRREFNPHWLQARPFPDVDVDPDFDFSALGSSLQSDAQAGLGCDYVCRYSFELLRASALSATQDYRTLLARFNEQFAGRRPRCRSRSDGTWEQCNGRSWESCGRFFGLQIPDQSAHDVAWCTKPCRRLPWHELSYRSVQGPRGVAYSSTPPGGPLQYCAASGRTLAVSHVWSHGQGGNPDGGFNECLHKRYSAIARDLGCDSYWIDAACIPSDPELRSAAIKTINPIFRDSKVTLICDKDIMEVDAAELWSVPRLEVLMSVLLLSDWNVRGWTMLEVVRGNKAVHLLCRDNRPVALHDVLAALYQGGSVDLCALLIGSPQLMPPDAKLRAPDIETAGVMLSRRYASRRGDDVIIWSLLCGDDRAHQSPVSLWESRKGSRVRTGFLMSSCDRIAGAPRGFGWAPATPLILGPHTSPRPPNVPLYWPYDGSGTSSARITPSADGKTTFLRGCWLAHLYSPNNRLPARQGVDLAGSCLERAEQLLSSGGYRRVIFLRPLFLESIESGWTQDLSAPFTAAQNLDEGEDVAVAVCATMEDHAQYIDLADPEEWTGMYELEPEGWEWKGVYRCPFAGSSSPLHFQARQVRII